MHANYITTMLATMMRAHRALCLVRALDDNDCAHGEPASVKLDRMAREQIDEAITDLRCEIRAVSVRLKSATKAVRSAQDVAAEYAQDVTEIAHRYQLTRPLSREGALRGAIRRMEEEDGPMDAALAESEGDDD